MHTWLSRWIAIAWLFNIRGGDVAFNPVVVSYAIVTQNHATLFVDRKKLTAAVHRALSKHVTIAPYEQITEALFDLKQRKQRVLA